MELVHNYVHPETGELITKERLEIKGLGKAKYILKPGGTLGDLYTNSDLDVYKRQDFGQLGRHSRGCHNVVAHGDESIHNPDTDLYGCRAA